MTPQKMPYSYEQELLIDLSKIYPYSKDLPPIDKSINIDSFLNLASSNGLLLLVIDKLKRDKNISKKLNNIELQTSPLKLGAISNHLEFDLLNRKFCEKGIPFIPIKGIILSRILYPQKNLRDMLDIDILAKYEDCRKIYEVLKELNYIQAYSDSEIHEELLPLLPDPGLNEYIDCIELVRGNFTLEIHFKMLSSKISSQISNEELFKEGAVTNIENQNLLLLSPEHQLISVATHAAYHNLAFGLRPITEIDGLINYYVNMINWDKFYETIAKYSLIELSYPPLCLSHHFYKTPIPTYILEKMEKGTSRIVSKITQDLKNNFFDRARIPILSDNTLCFFIMGQKNRLKSLKNIFFPPIKLLKLKLPASKSKFPYIYLQYFKRFFMLIKNYLPDIAKRLIFSLKMIYGRNS